MEEETKLVRRTFNASKEDKQVFCRVLEGEDVKIYSVKIDKGVSFNLSDFSDETSYKITHKGRIIELVETKPGKYSLIVSDESTKSEYEVKLVKQTKNEI